MEQVLSALRATAEETRLRLVALCARSDLTVTDLTRILGQSQPRISRHLKVLCDTGVVERLREGSWVFYRAAQDGVGGSVTRGILSLLPDNDSTLTADRARLTAIQEERAAAAGNYFRSVATDWNSIRSLHIDEAEVERVLVDKLTDRPLGDLIDIGTGTGRMLTLLGPNADRATGIDASREMLAVARSALEEQDLRHCMVRQGDMYALPLADHSVDTIVVHQVLHYAERPAAVITEAARVLKPGGRLALIDFAPHELDELREKHNHRRLGFAPDEVKELFSAAGLIPTETVPLPGRPLTVLLWMAKQPLVRPPLGRQPIAREPLARQAVGHQTKNGAKL